MVKTPSTMQPLGTPAPDFTLTDENPRTERGTLSLKDIQGPNGTLIVFMCNHCPYVKHLEDELATTARRLQEEGINVVAIDSNDVNDYPEDGPSGIKEQSQRAGFDFPYLFDDTQDVAKAYKAACTPDFFLYDDELALYYRGQFDSSRPGNEHPITGEDLTQAAKRLLDGEQAPEEQHPSQGCNIKWAPGNQPPYVG